MAKPPVAIWHHPDCTRHEMGRGHPEAPERVGVILEALRASDFAAQLHFREAPLATREQICRAHTHELVDDIFSRSPREGREILDPDTSMNPYSLDAARRAAGAAVEAVNEVLTGTTSKAFCVVRPPGHHAESRRAMGFCFFSSVAIAALHAIGAHGLKRVAVCDFDVHHGNGSEDILTGRKEVLLCQTFQSPLYPYTGELQSKGVVNVALKAGSDGEALRRAVEDEWLPALDAFRPELVLVSAGFDAHRDDPLAGLEWSDADFRWVTAQLIDIADKHSDGRLVSSLEGGYDLKALASSARAHVGALVNC